MRIELICENTDCGRHAEPGDPPLPPGEKLIRSPRRWSVRVDADLLDESRFALAEKPQMACPACGAPANRIIGGYVDSPAGEPERPGPDELRKVDAP